MKVLERLENKKVFALYLVGILLLSAGVSFAYFSATNSVTVSGGVATGVTAIVELKVLATDVKLTGSETLTNPYTAVE